MNSITKRASAACLALLMATSVGASAVPFSFGVNSAAVVASAEETTIDFPETRPTAGLSISDNGTYIVPVYIYNKDGSGASMANEAVGHTAVITINSDGAFATLNFHPIEKNDLIGHLEKFYYYNLTAEEYYDNANNFRAAENAEKRVELSGENVKYSFDDLGGSDSSSYVKYVSSVTFKLPHKQSDVVCRVKVDAMGDIEQDAVIVFDYSNIKSSWYSSLDSLVDVAKSIKNDDGKYTDNSYAAMQNAIATAEMFMEINDFWTEDLILSSGYFDLRSSISNLVLKDSIIPDGVYEVPTEFIAAKAETVSLDGLTKLDTYIPSDEKFTYLSDMLGDTATVTAKDGNYTVEYTAKNDGGEDYYLINFAKAEAWDGIVQGFTLVNETQKTDYFNDKTIYPTLTGNRVYTTLTNRYKDGELLCKCNVINKKEEGSIKFLGYCYLNVDWDSAKKIADVDPDKTQLSTQIEFADYKEQNTSFDDYTDESVAAYKAAYNKAVEVNENSKLQSEIDEAYQNLVDAMNGLKTYKTALQEKVDEVKAVDTAEYTEVSAKALADEIAKAEELLAQDEPANDELAAEIAALDSAVAALEKKPEDSSSEDDSSSQSDDSSAPDDSSSPDDSSVPDDPAPAKQSIAKATVKVSNKTYTGKALKPAVKVTLSGKTLKKGTDYTVSYKNNKKVGKATVTIKGKGSYTGSKSGSFIIKPAKMKIKAAKSTAKNKIKVTWTKAKGGVTGYKVQIALNKKFTKSKKTYTVKKATAASKTITKLKSGKKYFVRVRAYKTVGKKTYYGKYSAIKTVKVK